MGPRRPPAWRLALWLLQAAILLWSTPGLAGENDLALVPARVSALDPVHEQQLRAHAERLDQILLEAAPDLGLTPSREAASPLSDLDLPRLAKQRWVLLPRLDASRQGVTLRLTAVAPDSSVLLVRVEQVNLTDLEVRTVVMLQELIQSSRQPTTPQKANAPRSGDVRDHSLPPPSAGRAVLALNLALYGGYVGFTAHRGSGSDDARLLYPLTALGAGLGLGASMLVADEWDIGQGSAWYLSAGLVWPSMAGMALSEAYDGRTDRRHLYGLLGATGGLTLATTVASLTPVTGGHAALAHSGGAFGMLLGGLTEAVWEGELQEAPWRGVGYGALAGVLAAGALAPVTHISASRVLFIDLSTSLGALTGAAVVAPLLFVGDEIDPKRSRVLSASVAAGSLLGAGLGTWITSGVAEDEFAFRPNLPRPYLGLVGFDQGRQGKQKPVLGAGLSGTW